MSKIEIARDFLDSLDKPWPPKKTMAARLAKARPDVFKDTEDARSAVRCATGALDNGTKVTHRIPHGHQSDRPKMPEPWPDDWTGPWESPPGASLIIADMHVPHHDPVALEAALGYRKDFDRIVLLGDSLNCQRLSPKFLPDKDAPTILQEKQRLGLMLDMLIWYGKPVVYYAGNHEERWWKYIATRTPELAQDPDLDFDKFFGLADRGVEMVSYGRTLLFGKLHAFHGHEVTANSPFTPQNPSGWLLRQTNVNAVCGHFHRTSETTQRRADDSVVGAWTIGCTCTLTPRYARRNQWNHGFGFVEHDASGNFEFASKKVLDGKVR